MFQECIRNDSQHVRIPFPKIQSASMSRGAGIDQERVYYSTSHLCQRLYQRWVGQSSWLEHPHCPLVRRSNTAVCKSHNGMHDRVQERMQSQPFGICARRESRSCRSAFSHRIVTAANPTIRKVGPRRYE